MSYKITDGWLIGDEDSPVQRAPSPNHGGSIVPEFLIVHFTSGRSAETTVERFQESESRVSAHLVIGRNGSVTQLVPFHVEAWHAGVSRWADRVGLNSYSIGIELDNAGQLKRTARGWETWYHTVIPEEDVLPALHKNESVLSGWQTYTDVQLHTLFEIGATLVRTYGLKEVLGHDDVAPDRKNDPGPAFPMDEFRSYVMGRASSDLPVYRTVDTLNLRSGPSAAASKLVPSGLPSGTRVVELGSRSGSWLEVHVLDEIDGDRDLEGWVNSRYLSRAG